MNIRSFRKYKDEFELLMEKTKPDIMELTEANITDYKLPYANMDNYKITGRLRENRRGGGKVMYTRKENNTKEEFEELQIETGKDHQRLNILAIYRPPNKSKKTFIDQIKTKLENNEEIHILIGDINIDTMKATDKTVIIYENMMAEFGFIKCIQEAAKQDIRQGRITSSCIDHIYVRQKQILNSFILQTNISDYFTTGAATGNETGTITGNEKIFKNISDNQVRKAVKETTWKEIIKTDENNADVDTIYGQNGTDKSRK